MRTELALIPATPVFRRIRIPPPSFYFEDMMCCIKRHTAQQVIKWYVYGSSITTVDAGQIRCVEALSGAMQAVTTYLSRAMDDQLVGVCIKKQDRRAVAAD